MSATSYFKIDCKTGVLQYDPEQLSKLASTKSDTLINVQVQLTDDDPVVPITNKYFSTFLIPFKEVELFTPTNTTNTTYEYSVSFTMMNVNNEGVVWVYFSEPLMAPSNLTVIQELGLEIDLIPSSRYVDPKYQAFNWSVVSFYTSSMQIKLDFEHPLYIS